MLIALLFSCSLLVLLSQEPVFAEKNPEEGISFQIDEHTRKGAFVFPYGPEGNSGKGNIVLDHVKT